jgi:predicted enzyme related to lactoylglutathione lyase
MTTSGLQTVIFPVKDLDATKAVYTALFGEPHTDQPYYVGYRVGSQDIGLNPQGHAQGLTDTTGYWQVDDVAASLAELVAAGATVRQEPKDVGGGTLTASVTDPEGNTVGLIQRPVTSTG